VSATCVAGHASIALDYCDTCGAPIDPAAADTSASPASVPCPQCGVTRAGRDRYCEGCGFDFVAGAPADDPPDWSVLVVPDAEQFARTATEGLSFPAEPAPSREVSLVDSPVRIGRRRSSGEARVEIELDDPAASRLHASLVRADDGSWAIVDEGSSNGTTLNDDERAITPHVLVALHDGDRVHVGAWTTIVVSFDG
jgi:hypothetical protein